jgi:outer membrane protein assembly factor BamE (lipoprotein component of BamABCDE complex)
MSMKMTVALVFCIIANILSGCSNNIQTKGYQFEKGAINNITPNKSNLEDVIKVLGSPTVSAIYGEPKFFYIEQIYKTVPMRNPAVIDQKILEVTFQNNGIVKGIKEYNLKDIKKVDFNNTQTILPGNKIGALEQFLGNLGKYNNAGDSEVSRVGY